MQIIFAWDAYPDTTFNGWRIYYSPTLTGFTLLADIPDINQLQATVTAPAFGSFNYQLRAYKGTVESPPSGNIAVEFQPTAPTGWRRVS